MIIKNKNSYKNVTDFEEELKTKAIPEDEGEEALIDKALNDYEMNQYECVLAEDLIKDFEEFFKGDDDNVG